MPLLLIADSLGLPCIADSKESQNVPHDVTSPSNSFRVSLGSFTAHDEASSVGECCWLLTDDTGDSLALVRGGVGLFRAVDALSAEVCPFPATVSIPSSCGCSVKRDCAPGSLARASSKSKIVNSISSLKRSVCSISFRLLSSDSSESRIS